MEITFGVGDLVLTLSAEFRVGVSGAHPGSEILGSLEDSGSIDLYYILLVTRNPFIVRNLLKRTGAP